MNDESFVGKIVATIVKVQEETLHNLDIRMIGSSSGHQIV
jgi:hypothetical protein